MNLTTKVNALQCKKVQSLGFPLIRQKIFALLLDKNHLLIISFLWISLYSYRVIKYSIVNQKSSKGTCSLENQVIPRWNWHVEQHLTLRGHHCSSFSYSFSYFQSLDDFLLTEETRRVTHWGREEREFHEGSDRVSNAVELGLLAVGDLEETNAHEREGRLMVECEKVWTSLSKSLWRWRLGAKGGS